MFLFFLLFLSYDFFLFSARKTISTAIMWKVYTNLTYVPPMYIRVKKLRVLIINKNLCKSLGSRNGNDIIIWSWNNPPDNESEVDILGWTLSFKLYVVPFASNSCYFLGGVILLKQYQLMIINELYLYLDMTCSLVLVDIIIVDGCFIYQPPGLLLQTYWLIINNFRC